MNMISKCVKRYRLKIDAPNAIASTKSTTKTKNRILAIEAAPSAIPPNPNIAATMAMMKNIAAQRNIIMNV